MSKKIILFYPCIVRGWQAQVRLSLPMHFLNTATVLEHAGYEAKIIDQRVEPTWRSILLEELKKDPLCIIISSKTGTQIRHALEASKITKEYSKVLVVWGGAHPSLLPEQTLENEYIDIIIQGEGEETTLELAKALEAKTSLKTVKGIWFKENGHIQHTEIRSFINLNQQLPLFYNLIDSKKYLRHMFNLGHLSFFTSRGCSNPCTFCYHNVIHRKTWRALDPDIAVQRIKDFVKTYHLRGITFSDINFFADINRARKILEGIIKENLNIIISKITLSVNTLPKINKDDLELLERAGCRRICIGVESGSKRIQSLLKRPVHIPTLLEINRHLKSSLILPVYFFIMGIPTETKEDLLESVSLSLTLLKENPNAVRVFNIFTPFPGTELFDLAIKHGLQVPKRLEDWISFNYRNCVKNAPWLSKEMRELIEMLDFCNFFVGKRHYLKPYEKTNLFVVLLSNLYAPLARKRVENLFYKFPIEVKLAKFLRLYAKQE